MTSSSHYIPPQSSPKFEGRYNHVCPLLSMFRIRRDGELRPQPYMGGDSSITPGTRVTFLFRLPRTFLFGDFILIFPEGFEPDDTGLIPRWADYDDACYGAGENWVEEVRLEDYMEEEYFLFRSFPLDQLEIYRTCDLPKTVDEWLDQPESDLEYSMYIYETVEVEWVYGEGWNELQTFLDWANALPKWTED